MNIHAAVAVGTSQIMAGNTPLIFAGDFNIKPDSCTYHLITTGSLPADNNESVSSHPPPYLSRNGNTVVPWKNGIIDGGMYSAHALAEEGREPTLTNYAHTKHMEEPFVGTLDYIFCSKGVGKNGEGGAHWRNVRSLSTMLKPVE